MCPVTPTRHLGLEEGKTPRGSSYAEMICRGCVADNPFLTAYRELDCGQEPESVEVRRYYKVLPQHDRRHTQFVIFLPSKATLRSYVYCDTCVNFDFSLD